MIVQIVGTMGAGKTTLVRDFMFRRNALRYPAPIEVLDENNKGVIGYRLCILRDKSAFVVGNYGRPSGGCDGIRSQDEVRRRISAAWRLYDYVLFEGMTVTCSVGTYFEYLGDLAPDDHCFAFLHPPVEVCVERVLARRAARGAGSKPFDPEGVVRHHTFVTRAIERAAAAGVSYVVLDWRQPLLALNGLLEARRYAKSLRELVKKEVSRAT